MKTTSIKSVRYRQGRKVFHRLVFLAMLLFFYSTHTFAQGTSFTYNFVKGFLIGEGYTICQDKYALLAQGETSSMYLTFYANTTCKIVAFSDDEDVTDVDLYVYNSDGTEYAKNNDNSALAQVVFTPYIARYLNVVWKNHATNTPRYKSNLYMMIGYK